MIDDDLRAGQNHALRVRQVMVRQAKGGGTRTGQTDSDVALGYTCGKGLQWPKCAERSELRTNALGQQQSFCPCAHSSAFSFLGAPPAFLTPRTVHCLSTPSNWLALR